MKKTLLMLVTFGMLADIATAQELTATQAAVEIKNVKAQMMKTPEYQGTTSDSKKDPKRREWFEIEIEIETKSDSKIGMIDNLVFKYYLAVKGAEKVNYILTENITYENIPDDEQIYTVVYVSPWSLARMAGGLDEFTERDVVAIGCEVLFNGERKGLYSSTNTEFWNSGGSFVRKQGMILPKEKSPFQFLWIDRHLGARLDR
ncbi:MAG: hypothetical protein ACI8UO_004848 [Verrucomicrobiales bacterium]|jgi:hypothetical protein